jgi:hypothetical protein
MTLKRLALALALILAPLSVARADQASITQPTSGPHSETDLATNYLNPALRSITGNFFGTACSGIASPVSYQWCVDTTAKSLNMYTPTSGGVFGWTPLAYINADRSIGYTGKYMYASSSTLPALFLQNTGAATNAKEWGFTADTNTVYFSAFNDAETVSGDFLTATRNPGSQTIARVNFPVSPSFNATGVIADSSTDNCTALNAALAAGDVTLPSTNTGAYYRTSCTIVVPFGSTLRGVGHGTTPGATNVGGAKIVCDAAVSPCIKVGTGNTNQNASLYNIYQSRAGGTPGSTTIGIWIFGGQMDSIVDVASDNNGINFLWGRSTIGAGAGLSHVGTRLISTRAVDAHMVFDGIPDVRISQSHIGSTGPNDYHANAAFRFTCTQHDCSGAGGTNTIFVENTQVNQAFHRIEHFAEFVDADPGFTATYAIFVFDNVYAESLNNVIYSDASWPVINTLKFNNSTIATNTTTAEGAGGRFFNLNAATGVNRLYISHSDFYSADEGGVQAFRLNPTVSTGLYEMHIDGSGFYGNTYFTGFNGSTASIIGTTFSNNLTIDGSWAYYNEFGTNIGGTYSESAGNNALVVNNRQIKIPGGGISNLGLSCASGITASTFRSVNGIVTHC